MELNALRVHSLPIDSKRHLRREALFADFFEVNGKQPDLSTVGIMLVSTKLHVKLIERFFQDVGKIGWIRPGHPGTSCKVSASCQPVFAIDGHTCRHRRLGVVEVGVFGVHLFIEVLHRCLEAGLGARCNVLDVVFIAVRLLRILGPAWTKGPSVPTNAIAWITSRGSHRMP